MRSSSESRRDFLRMAGSALLPSSLDAQGMSSRPNIIFILADDLGYGDLSSYGAAGIQTPHIDSLANQGVLFTDAHSPAAVCMPTRYGLLTGRYCWRTWLKQSSLGTDGPLLIEEDRPTVASMLRSAGYYTACIGKWHLGFGREDGFGQDRQGQGVPSSWRSRHGGPNWNGELKPGPLEVGFDYYYGIPIVNSFPPYVFVENHHVVGLRPEDPIGQMESSYRGNMQGGKAARWKDEELAIELTAKAVTQLESAAKRQPFFLYYCPHQPHKPYTPNRRFKGTSRCGVYGDFIHELDWSVGEVLGALDRLGLAENTLVIFSSDNGALKAPPVPDLNNHQPNGPDLRGGKADIWEGGNRVPFIARWPGKIQPGTRSSEMICLVDMFATCAGLIGKSLPPGAGPDSFNVLPALFGRKLEEPLRGPMVMQSGRQGGMLAIREGPWKLILGRGGGGATEPDPNEPPIQLYNLDEDLGEKKNIYDSHPDIVRRLQNLLQKIKERGDSRGA